MTNKIARHNAISKQKTVAGSNQSSSEALIELTNLHRTICRGDGHRTIKETAGCIGNAFACRIADNAELEKEVNALKEENTSLKAVVEARAKLPEGGNERAILKELNK